MTIKLQFKDLEDLEKSVKQVQVTTGSRCFSCNFRIIPHRDRNDPLVMVENRLSNHPICNACLGMKRLCYSHEPVKPVRGY